MATSYTENGKSYGTKMMKITPRYGQLGPEIVSQFWRRLLEETEEWNDRTVAMYDSARECVEEEVNASSDVFFVDGSGEFVNDVLVANAAARSAYRAYGEIRYRVTIQNGENLLLT